MNDKENRRIAMICKLNEIRVFLTGHSLYDFKQALETMGISSEEADLAHKIGFTVSLLDDARALLEELRMDESESQTRTEG